MDNKIKTEEEFEVEQKFYKGLILTLFLLLSLGVVIYTMFIQFEGRPFLVWLFNPITFLILFGVPFQICWNNAKYMFFLIISAIVYLSICFIVGGFE